MVVIKLSPLSCKRIFLRYSHTQKGYRCYSLESCWYFVSADVTFFESTPFFFSPGQCLSSDLISSREGDGSFLSPTLPIPLLSPHQQVPLASPPNPPFMVEEWVPTIYTRTNGYLDSLKIGHVMKFFVKLRTYLKMNKPLFESLHPIVETIGYKNKINKI